MSNSHHLLLPLLLLSAVLAAANDGPAILKIASSFRRAPRGWSSTSSDHYCKWPGIKCDKSNCVTSINLSSKSLSGTISPDISTLSELRSVSLRRNSLSGTIPSFANLSSLQSIYLDGNAFTWVSPDAFSGLTNLQTLNLSDNMELSPWTFPDLSQSTRLVEVQLDNTNLLGTLPDIFDSMNSLQSIRLSNNNLSGTLPVSLGGSMIQNLWINNQKGGFTGNLEVLSNMAQLSQVWLHKNMFAGPIPDLSKCMDLFDLQLRENLLTGPVPESLINLPSLKNVSLSNNKLQGPNPLTKFPKTVEEIAVNGTNNFCTDNGDPCDPQVATLLDIAGGFGYPVPLSDDWAGNDACKWPFVTCDTQGNVITVNLAKKNLVGTISPAFGNLTALKNLNLNDNNLTGPIPSGLTKLSSLQLLDVSNNNLSGDIPTFSGSVKFVYAGNSLLGKSGDSGDGGTSGSAASDGGSDGNSKSGGNGKNSIALIVGIVFGVLVFVVVVCFVSYKYIVNKKHGKFGKMEDSDAENKVVKNGTMGVEMKSQSNGDHSDRHFFEGRNVVIPMQVLKQATDNFNEANILRRERFGVVYKGKLHDGTEIAVKRMGYVATGAKRMIEFQAEIAVLTKVRHRHLVALLGYCIHGNENYLVYEYMPKGTLGHHLFGWRENGYAPLTWKQRVTIALDVARGVEYLHSLAQQSFIHRDLKPPSILLSDNMRAKVSNFGLVKNAPEGMHSVETRLAGTLGYLAPEYAATGRVTTKVDVFAFGVVLMEIITGRKSLDETLPCEKSDLVPWFRRVLINKENIPKVVDDTINGDDDTMASVVKVAELAGHCTACKPYHRPDMGHVVNVLGPLVQQWKPTSQVDYESSGRSLPLALQRWQPNEGTSTMYNDFSYSYWYVAPFMSL
ncbi:hypothetical protein DITRI_Ditri17bG0030500 [Diplodiscus trichospermus]